MLIDRIKKIKTLCDLSLSNVEGMPNRDALVNINVIVDTILDSNYIGDYAKIDEGKKPKVCQKQVEALKGGN